MVSDVGLQYGVTSLATSARWVLASRSRRPRMQPVFFLEKKCISFKCKSQLINAKKFLLPHESFQNAVLN